MKSAKIIFLDIDGVLQPCSSKERFQHDLYALQKELAEKFNNEDYLKMNIYDLGAVYYDWYPEAVTNLKKLISETNAKIVISSNWSSYNTLDRLRDFFKIHDLDVFIIDEIPKNINSRAKQIEEYVLNNPNISKFVILDDVDSGISSIFPKNFVHTTKDYFNEKCLNEALKILG